LGALEHLLQLVARGLLNTAALTALSLPPALAGGVALGLARAYSPPRVARVLDAWSDALRGVPLLALLYALVYGLPDLGLSVDTVLASAAALALCSSAYVSEYVRTAVLSSASGEVLAARSLGMSRLQEIRYVVLPRLLRTLAPAITNEAVYIIHGSTLAGLVGVYELFSAVRTYISTYFDTWTPLLTAAAIYVLLTVALDAALRLPARRRGR